MYYFPQCSRNCVSCGLKASIFAKVDDVLTFRKPSLSVEVTKNDFKNSRCIANHRREERPSGGLIGAAIRSLESFMA